MPKENHLQVLQKTNRICDMTKIYVHDFFFESAEIENEIKGNDFFYSVNIYFNFSQEDPGDGWDDLEYFNISVANPFGLAKYLQKTIDQGILGKNFFFSNLLIFIDNDKEAIMKYIKAELQSINGKSEKEVMLKALRKFSWENEYIPDVYNRLFS